MFARASQRAATVLARGVQPVRFASFGKRRTQDKGVTKHQGQPQESPGMFDGVMSVSCL
jgi:hypothetical protein